MAKFDEKTIEKYLNGDYISDEEIEKLEDNKYFMEKVISLSKDKNLYDRCSNEIKKDTGFMRFLIKNFKNDVDFLCNAADYYFDNTDDEDYKIEIAIVMSAITKKNEDDRYLKYSLIKNVLYSAFRLEAECEKASKKDDMEFQYETGLGFWCIKDVYKGDKIIVDFFAKKMIKELFVENYYALENVLHEQYKEREELEEKGLYNCLLNAVRIYDDELYAYLCVNKDLLTILLPKYIRVLKKWDNYVNYNEKIKYELLYEDVYREIEDNTQNGMFTTLELFTFAGAELGIIDKLIEYDIIDACDIDEIRENRHYYLEVIKNSFVDRLNYNNVKRKIKEVLFEHQINKNQAQEECKVLTLNDFRKPKTNKNKQ